MRIKLIIVMGIVLLCSGCTTPRPDNIENICSVFNQYPSWYWAAKKSQDKWGVPVNVQMAIIYQESRFTAKAKPPRKRLLGIIPWFRPTSAYGYAQSLKSTWKHYERSTGNSGNRDDFKRATDFIGWYGNLARARTGMSLTNAYELYLAYHEGIGGYSRHTYWHKPWLIKVARKVAYRAFVYKKQLWTCESKIKKPHWWNIFGKG